MSDPGAAVAHGVMAEDEGGPRGQLVALSSFTGANTEARLDLSTISQTDFLLSRDISVVPGGLEAGTHLMFAGDVGNILMDSFITEFK